MYSEIEINNICYERIKFILFKIINDFLIISQTSKLAQENLGLRPCVNKEYNKKL